MQHLKKSYPRIGEIEEVTNLCVSAVELVVFPLIFTTIFAMYEIKVGPLPLLFSLSSRTCFVQNEGQDAEINAKLAELRKIPLAQQMALLGEEHFLVVMRT